jgi:hypothetical protein
MNIRDGFCLYQDELLLAITKRYEKMLENEFNKTHPETRNYSTIKSVVKALGSLSAGQGQLMLADFYIEHIRFAKAFRHYLSIYSNLSCSKQMKESAGFELANLIYNGLVVLTDGELNVSHSSKRRKLTEESQKIEGNNLQIMRQRAIQAYEYLHNNSCADAKILKKRLDTILSDNLEMGGDKPICWSEEATIAFHDYYKIKNLYLSKLIALHQQSSITSTGLGLFNRAEIHDVKQYENPHTLSVISRTTT